MVVRYIQKNIFFVKIIFFPVAVFAFGLLGTEGGETISSGCCDSYGAPEPSYGAPSPSYGSASGYGAPEASYGAPSPSYGAPAQSYGAPAASYDAPSSGYNAARYYVRIKWS